MKFTYQAYRGLLSLLKEEKYEFRDYHTYMDCPRCVILRHDIDTSIGCALKMAQVEAEEQVKSTYFVLLTSDFYNVASAKSLAGLRAIQALGMEIGLHFDETAYGDLMESDMVCAIQKECRILSELLECDVSAVSMHRPSQKTLNANLLVPGVENSYSNTFFRDFKYLSDSRCRWREPVLEIIRSGAYDLLHILTHPFWYHEEEQTITQSVTEFIRSANRERYCQMNENITELAAILKGDCL